jgi:hypothetical protein
MNGTTVFRLISLIPDRVARTQTGGLFDRAGSEKVELLSRFLGWLSPLNPTSKEEQQLLGVRAGGAKPLAEGEEAGEELGEEEVAEEAAEDAGEEAVELLDDLEETPIRLPGAGTQIAA